MTDGATVGGATARERVVIEVPLFHLVERHVLAAERLHGDDTTIRILAKGKCTTRRSRTYVRDDRPFAGPALLAAVYYASSDRRGEHPQKHLAAFAGILQADCYIASSLRSRRRRRCCRLRRRFALPMRGGASSSWLTSRKMLGEVRRQTGFSDRTGGGQTPGCVARDRSRHQWPPLLEDMHAWLPRERETSHAPPRS
ncbi:IS66 family transposase [Bradyrhizobium sp. UFLA01-814]|uniref:IS66 family transposase n=1 Tax=Bradyrhizobium sp. UFLA01-814 TaxID=3023480 RepID=UPI00398B7DE9